MSTSFEERTHSALPPSEALDLAWQRLREGDAHAAREIVELLLASGDESALQTAVSAIGRHFSREVQRLVAEARLAQGEEQRALSARAIEALVLSSIASQLPELVRRSLAPQDLLPGLPAPTQLVATGVDRGITLTWLPSVTTLPLLGQRVSVYRDGLLVRQSALLPISQQTFPATELENGISYVLVVETVAQTFATASANVTGVAGAVQSALPAVTGLAATPSDRALTFRWDRPTVASGVTIRKYLLTLTGELVPRQTEVMSTGPTETIRFSNLDNGAIFQLAVQTVGDTPSGANQLGLTGTLSAIPGLSGTPFVPKPPILPSSDLLILDPNIATEVLAAQRAMTEVNAIAQKWQFDYLKERATAAAERALSYDREILSLMSMTLTKAVGAQSQFTPLVLAALADIKDDTQRVIDAGSAPPVMDAIEDLSSAVSNAVVMAAVLNWLARNDAFDVWIGFFESLIGDVAAFDSSFSRVKGFFEDQYTNGPFGRTVRSMTALSLDRIGATISATMAPIRGSISALIGSTSAKMSEVFRNFDLPLTLTPGPNGTLIPNANPLLADLQQLARAVDEFEAKLHQRVRERLLDVVEGRARALFRDLMIAYFVVPIAAALVIAIAGGPIAAAILAAIVLIAAEALLHLLARLLLGPLTDQLAALEQIVSQRLAGLQRGIADQALDKLMPPTGALELLRGELRQLRALLPQAFLDDIAALLAQARNVTLDTGVLHALAAERALGYDQATAFDRIQPRYASPLRVPADMPGGRDPRLFSGSALLRDLDLLDQDRIRLLDGREVFLTRRISLFEILGGIGDPLTATAGALGRFGDFLRSGRCVVDLVPELLLDHSSPGVYRALVTGVRAFAISKLPVAASALGSAGLAVTLTHSGESWTRVKRSSNPHAPPIALPVGLPDEDAYLLALTYRDASAPYAPNSLEGAVWSVVASIREPLTWTAVRRACLEQLPAAVAELGNISLLRPSTATARAALPGHPAQDAIDERRDSYYSSPETTDASTIEWLCVALPQTSEVVTGVRLWPRPGELGFPAQFEIQVADSDVESAFRTVPWSQITVASTTTAGREARYYHFQPRRARYVRVRATQLTQSSPGQYSLQLADFAVEVMNVDVSWHRFDTITGSAAQTGHPLAALIASDPTTFYSSLPLPSPNPPMAERPWFNAGVSSARLINRIRLTPRAGTDASFPPKFQLVLADGEVSYPFQFTNYAIQGPEPQDFNLARCRTTSLRMQVDTLPRVGQDYALQLAGLEIATFSSRPSLVPTQTAREIVASILEAMAWPPAGQPDPRNVAAQLADALQRGVPSRGLRGLADVAGSPGGARAAWQGGWSHLMARIGKWAGAQQREDPDPNVRALDYVQLVQRFEPQAVTCDLFPVDDGVARPGMVMRALGNGAAAPTAQYSQFQNLGIGGSIAVEAPGAAAAMLADLVLEIDIRALSDPKLAAATRAASTQRELQLERMVAIGALSNRVLTMTGPVVKLGTGGVQTFQFSWRAHRDRLLQAAVAGAQVSQGTTGPISTPVDIDGIQFVPNQAAPLKQGRAFGFFSDDRQSLPGTIGLAFARDANLPLVQQLNCVPISAGVLGVDAALLNGLLPNDPTGEPAGLIGLGVALVPMPGVSNFEFGLGAIDSAFLSLLPPAWSAPDAKIRSLLTLTTPAQSKSAAIPFAGLFGETARMLQIDLGPLVASGAIYDVIFSVICRVPTLSTTA